VFDMRANRMRVFKPGEDRAGGDEEVIEGIDNPASVERFGDAFTEARDHIELLEGASATFDRAAFLQGGQTPVFFGSAINNFGVREVLDSLVELAPPPGPKPAVQRVVQPTEPRFTGVVFKIQANMDPAHRDRVAFVRVCSGRFERGMKLTLARTGKEVKTNTAVSFLSQRRDLVEDAWPGDIVGLPNRGVLQLGDTLTEGEHLQFTGLPFFAPEIFHTVEVADPIRNKQLRVGLQQLGEEGAIQVFRPSQGGALLLGAVGQLQLEVVAHRLEGEYQARARMTPSNYRLARWITAEDPAELERFIEANAHRVAYDVVDAPAVLYTHASELKAAREIWPKIHFHTLREHGGLVVHGNKIAA
jgi:peptide chain release factor 3